MIVMLGYRGLFRCKLFVIAIQFEDHMLEEHVNTEHINIYKMFNLQIPPSKHKYHCPKETPVGDKLLPTTFSIYFYALSFTV